MPVRTFYSPHVRNVFEDDINGTFSSCASLGISNLVKNKYLCCRKTKLMKN